MYTTCKEKVLLVKELKALKVIYEIIHERKKRHILIRSAEELQMKMILAVRKREELRAKLKNKMFTQ